MTHSTSAVVLFSGGQDSATCLAWALDRFDLVETIGYDYRQRHRVELDCRNRIRGIIRADFREWSDRLGNDHLLDLPVLGAISDTALTREAEISLNEDGLPSTFVPGRNLLFLTLAAAVAYRRNISTIVAGVSEADYSGYPDCRDDTIKAMTTALNLGMATHFTLETPLMRCDKGAVWSMADALGGEALVDLIREETHSCYLGDRHNRHEWGYGCGTCPACILRKKGYQQYIATLTASAKP